MAHAYFFKLFNTFSQNCDHSERLNFESGLFFWVNLDIIYVGGSPLVGLATNFAHEKQIEGLVWSRYSMNGRSQIDLHRLLVASIIHSIFGSAEKFRINFSSRSWP